MVGMVTLGASQVGGWVVRMERAATTQPVLLSDTEALAAVTMVVRRT